MLLPKPFAVVLLTKVVPPSVEILNPPLVAAYTVFPSTYTLNTLLFPNPFAVVLLTKVVPPSVEILNPNIVAA